MLKITHFLTQLKISPKIKDDIYIPELERTKGAEMAQKITMSSLGRFWQVLFKGYEELQLGSHLYQLGEMIIIRLIYLYDGPSPDELIQKIEQKIEKNKNSSPVIRKNVEERSSKTVNFSTEIKNNVEQNDEKTPSHIVTIKSFRQFVDIFYQKREGILHAHLYNAVKLISFKEGEIVINTEKISDPNFPRIIARYISKWTGRIWTITSSNSNIGKTLQEEDIITQQKEIEIMKKDPEIQNMFNKFPGISIHSITPIGETSDEKEDILTEQNKSEVE
jgi:DNA polymerase-3 subunit gamma/tau